MLEDFKRALARVQSDYGFYIECQRDPAVALEGYALSPEERSALTDPEKLADEIKRGIGVSGLRITISGTHDWVNRAASEPETKGGRGDAKLVADDVEAIRRASTDEERTKAVMRLMDEMG